MSQIRENGLGETEVDRILEEFLRTTEECIRILENWVENNTEEIDVLEQRLAGLHTDWEELQQFLDETQIEEIIENYANNRLTSQNVSILLRCLRLVSSAQIKFLQEKKIQLYRHDYRNSYLTKAKIHSVGILLAEV